MVRPIRKIGLLLARRAYIRKAILERADLKPFKARPSFKLVLGVSLIALSMLLAWPAITLIGLLAVYLKEPLLLAIGGPISYGLSWAVYGVGLLISGREAIYYMNVFNRWLLRVSVEAMIGKPPIEPGEKEDPGKDGEEGP